MAFLAEVQEFSQPTPNGLRGDLHQSGLEGLGIDGACDREGAFLSNGSFLLGVFPDESIKPWEEFSDVDDDELIGVRADLLL